MTPQWASRRGADPSSICSTRGSQKPRLRTPSAASHSRDAQRLHPRAAGSPTAELEAPSGGRFPQRPLQQSVSSAGTSRECCQRLGKVWCPTVALLWVGVAREGWSVPGGTAWPGTHQHGKQPPKPSQHPWLPKASLQGLPKATVPLQGPAPPSCCVLTPRAKPCGHPSPGALPGPSGRGTEAPSIPIPGGSG